MAILIKAAIIGIVAAILSLVIKKTNPEMALMLIVAAGCLVVGLALELASGIREVVELAAGMSQTSPTVLVPVFKCVGVGIITKLSSDVCRDAGAGMVASGVELAGTAAALFITLPLVKTLIQMLSSLM